MMNNFDEFTNTLSDGFRSWLYRSRNSATRRDINRKRAAGRLVRRQLAASSILPPELWRLIMNQIWKLQFYAA